MNFVIKIIRYNIEYWNIGNNKTLLTKKKIYFYIINSYIYLEDQTLHVRNKKPSIKLLHQQIPDKIIITFGSILKLMIIVSGACDLCWNFSISISQREKKIGCLVVRNFSVAKISVLPKFQRCQNFSVAKISVLDVV